MTSRNNRLNRPATLHKKRDEAITSKYKMRAKKYVRPVPYPYIQKETPWILGENEKIPLPPFPGRLERLLGQ